MNNSMNLSNIAGYCPETAIWKMLMDVSRLLQGGLCRFCPQTVMIDGDTFLLVSADRMAKEFLAPEQDDDATPTEQQAVWTLGAIAYYLSSGHIIFGGNGGTYQREHPSVPLPVLQKAHQSLTPLLQRCLCANPAQRIRLQELERLAQKGWESSMRQERERERQHAAAERKAGKTSDSWPEEMEETV